MFEWKKLLKKNKIEGGIRINIIGSGIRTLSPIAISTLSDNVSTVDRLSFTVFRFCFKLVLILLFSK